MVLKGTIGVSGVWPRYGNGRQGQLGASGAILDGNGNMPREVVRRGFPWMQEVQSYCRGGHAWPCRQSIREALPSGEHTPGPPDEVAAKAGLCRMYRFAQRQEAKEGGVQHVPSM